ncbi:hypothetical protein EC9_30370 [Rosistilla ulvae]|uniref:Uncharacterized protein n=1 Tax=Rosistilla ulvae TaxID=1930277 RepID=A0A517M1U0_9BACT|nr:hypothetical protein EC9_30370 [Rosistilla ulvae]
MFWRFDWGQALLKSMPVPIRPLTRWRFVLVLLRTVPVETDAVPASESVSIFPVGATHLLFRRPRSHPNAMVGLSADAIEFVGRPPARQIIAGFLTPTLQKND